MNLQAASCLSLKSAGMTGLCLLFTVALTTVATVPAWGLSKASANRLAEAQAQAQTELRELQKDMNSRMRTRITDESSALVARGPTDDESDEIAEDGSVTESPSSQVAQKEN